MTHGTGSRRASSLRTSIAMVALTVVASSSSAALAGSIPLSWDPVSHPELAGYRIYYGLSSGAYTTSVDAGNSIAFVLDGLSDCTRYSIAVKSYTSTGVESTEYSNEITGMATPVVASIAPASAEQGADATVLVSGSNFDEGARVGFSGSGIVVGASSLVSCSQVLATVSIALVTAPGVKRVEVTNPDLSRGGGNLFSVLALHLPIVVSATPLDGASSVSTSTRPTVSFSAQMDPASITTLTVRILGPGAIPVAQAPGSPTLDNAGLVATITPLRALERGTTYRVQVIGGAQGARDSRGHPLAAGYIQATGFTTSDATALPTVVSTIPSNGAREVPVSTRPAVSFNLPMDRATLTPLTVRLLGPTGALVAQASGSPQIDASGMIATIVPLEALPGATAFRLEVVGGGAGVRDEQGQAMAADFRQPTGFTTEDGGLPPSVTGTSPSGGAVDVPDTVRPRVRFDRPMDPLSITPLTVQLLDDTDQPVPQAPGSPSLDAAGVVATIAPLADLPAGVSYRIHVVGSEGGVRDQSGTTMAEDFVRTAGFTTSNPGDAVKLDPPSWYDDVDQLPTIAFLSSMDAPVGAYVAIYGDDFGTQTGSVRFGTENSSIVSWSRRKIVAVVPHNGHGPLAVRTSANVEAEQFPFTLVAGAVRHLDINEPSRGDGTSDHPWNRFEDANAGVQPGDFVVVHGGVYSGTLAQEAVFKATTSGQPDRSITYFADPYSVVYIDGYSVAKQAIRARADHVGFVGFVAAGAKLQGILLEGAGTRAIDNEVKEGVSLAAKGQGFNIDGDGAQALGNYVHDNDGDGLYANANDLLLGYNTIVRSGKEATDQRGTGIRIDRPMPGPSYFDARVMRNSVTDNRRSGISVEHYSVGADVRENVIAGNGEHCVALSGNARSTFLRNNTCYRNSTAGGGTGGFHEISLDAREGAVHVIAYNNAVTGARALSKSGALGGNLYLDFNFYDDEATEWAWDGTIYTTLAGWAAGTGRDRLSVIGDPLYADPARNDFRPLVGSPMIDRGFTIGCARSPWGLGCDIGAFEYRDEATGSLPPVSQP